NPWRFSAFLLSGGLAARGCVSTSLGGGALSRSGRGAAARAGEGRGGGGWARAADCAEAEALLRLLRKPFHLTAEAGHFGFERLDLRVLLRRPQKRPARGGLDHPNALSLQTERHAGGVADQRAVRLRVRRLVETSLRKTEALELRVSDRERVVEEVLVDAEVFVESLLAVEVVALRAVRADLDDQARDLAFCPDLEGSAERQLGNALHDHDVGADGLSR